MTHPVACVDSSSATGRITRRRCITAFPEPDADIGICAFHRIPGGFC